MSTMRRLLAAAMLAASCAAGVSAQSLGDASGGGVAPAPAGGGAVAPPGAPSTRACTECGVVIAIRSIEERGQASGVGAVAGGVIGGVLGHQIGSGRGNTAATIAGAGAGAYAGNQIEKNRNRKSYWTVALRMDDGRARSLTYSARPSVREGDRVRLVDGGKRLAVLAN